MCKSHIRSTTPRWTHTDRCWDHQTLTTIDTRVPQEGGRVQGWESVWGVLGIPLLGKVYWVVGFLASWFLVSWFLVWFVVSLFRSFEVHRFHQSFLDYLCFVSKFIGFKVQKIEIDIYCVWQIVDPVLKTSEHYHFMLSEIYWSHIQDFRKTN